MSNSNHTPGPWASHKDYVLDQYGNKVAVACPGRHLGQGDPLANARLIAAAPELLAALEGLVSARKAGFYSGEWEQAKLAIAKAKS